MKWLRNALIFTREASDYLNRGAYVQIIFIMLFFHKDSIFRKNFTSLICHKRVIVLNNNGKPGISM